MFAGPLQVSSFAIKQQSNSTLSLVWDNVKSDAYNIVWNCSSPNTNETNVFYQNVITNTAESDVIDSGSFCTIVIKAFIHNFYHGELYGSAFVILVNASTLEEGLFVVIALN